MGQILKGTPLSYVSTGQGFFARTTQGDIFCIARSDINSSEVTVIVEDNGAAIAVCESTARVIYSQSSQQIRRGQRVVPVPVCQVLRPAFLLRVENTNKSQDYYLLDFSGDLHHLVNIPAATEYYNDATWEFTVTIPAYNRRTYELYGTFEYNLNTDSFIDEGGFIEDPDPNLSDSLLSNTNGQISITGTREYGERTYPIPLEVQNVTFTNNEVWSRAELGYFYASPGSIPPGGYRYFNLGANEDIGDGDSRLNWREIWDQSSASLPAVVNAETGEKWGYPFQLTPWRDLNGAYTGSNQTNPDGFWTYYDDDNDGSSDRMTGRVASARYFATQWLGDLTVDIPPGQQKPPPTDEFSESEGFISYSDGSLKAIIRFTGRPSGRSPGEAGQPGAEGDPYWTYVQTFELGTDGSIATPGGFSSWFGYLNSSEQIDDIDQGIPRGNFHGWAESRAIQQKKRYTFGLGGYDRYSEFVDIYIPSIENVPITVPTGIETVYGWAFRYYINTEYRTFQDYLLGIPEQSAQVSYSLESLQVFGYDSSGARIESAAQAETIGTTLGGTLSPFAESATKMAIQINPIENPPATFTSENLKVADMTASFDINATIDLCWDISQLQENEPDIS